MDCEMRMRRSKEIFILKLIKKELIVLMGFLKMVVGEGNMRIKIIEIEGKVEEKLMMNEGNMIEEKMEKEEEIKENGIVKD